MLSEEKLTQIFESFEKNHVNCHFSCTKETVLENINALAVQFDQFKQSEEICVVKVITDYSNSYAARVLLPYFIAKWRLLIRDQTRVFHLIPSLVLLKGFSKRMISSGIRKYINNDEELVHNPPSTLVKHLVSFFFDAQGLIPIIEMEIQECRDDPIRSKDLSDAIIEIEIERVYERVFPNNSNITFNELEDSVEIPRSSSILSNTDDIAEEIIENDFKVVMDLFEGLPTDNDRIYRDFLDIVPLTVGDFDNIKKDIINEYHQLKDDHLIIIENVLMSISKTLNPSFLRKLSKELKSLV